MKTTPAQGELPAPSAPALLPKAKRIEFKPKDPPSPPPKATGGAKALRIGHLADIHVQDSYRDNYRAVFGRLYDVLHQEAPDIIVVAGDVFETKTRASANNFMDVSAFLMALVDIAPVVLIPGNHDTNIRVQDGPDLLTPVLAENLKLQAPALTYFRKSGVYAAHGIIWAVVAPDGEKVSEEDLAVGCKYWQDEGQVKDDAIRICLFHEEVDGANLSTDLSGYTVTLRDSRLRVADFAPYDAALGGHIHLRQGGPRWSYCGSLIQQNIGEPHDGHGFLIWELAKRDTILRPDELHLRGLGREAERTYRTEIPKRRGVDVPNECGFLRVEIKGGVDVTVEPRPAKPYYYRVQYDQKTDKKAVDAIVEGLVGVHGFAPRTVDCVDAIVQGEAPLKQHTIQEARNEALAFDAHEAIIREILSESPHIEDVVLRHRREFEEYSKNVPGRARIRLLRIEFDNMYCYGTGNSIDFTKLEGGLNGVVAPNFSGKSTLIDTIIFALYDKCPRGEQKTDAINRAATSYRVRLEFEADGQKGVIMKSGSVSGKKATKRHCNFTMGDEDRTQGDVVKTCEAIQRVVGDYQSAQLTTISHQKGGIDLVTMKPEKRKARLAHLLSLGSFDKLEKAMAREQTVLKKKKEAEAKRFKGKTASELESEIETIKNSKEKLETERAALRKSLLSLEAEEQKHAQKLAEARASAKLFADLKMQDPEAVQAQIAQTVAERKKLQVSLGEADLEKIEEECAHRTPGRAVVPSSRIYPKKILDGLHNRVLAASKERDEMLKNRPNKPDADRESQITSELSRARLRLASLHREVPEQLYKADPWCAQRSNGANESPTQDEVNAAQELVKNVGVPHEKLSETIEALTTKLCAVEITEADGEFEDLQTTEEEDIKGAKQLSIVHRIAKLEMELDSAKAKWAQIDAKLRSQVERSYDEEVKIKKVFIDGVFESQLQQELQTAEAKLAAALSGAALLGSFGLQPKCSGCDRVREALSQQGIGKLQKERDAAKQMRALWILDAIKSKQENLNEEKGILDQHTKHVARRARLEVLKHEKELSAANEIIQKQLEALKAVVGAVALLEIASGFHAKRQAEIAAAQASQAEAEALDARISELEAQRATLVATRHNHTTDLVAAESVHAKALQAYEIAAAARAGALLRVLDLVAKEAKLQKELKEAESKKQAFEKIKSLKTLESSSAAAAEKIKAARQRLEELLVSSGGCDTEIRGLEISLEAERERAESFEQARKDLEVVMAYRRVLRADGGIGDRLLAKARELLAELLKKELAETGAQFEADLGENFELYTKTPQGHVVAAKQASGYQDIAISLALRRAAWRLAAVPVLDALVIDEGLAACDEKNLPAMAEHLERVARLRDGPRLSLLVTHLEALRSRLDRALVIEKRPAGSYVSNSAVIELRVGEQKAPLAEAEAVAAAPPPEERVELIPDPDNAGKVWCPVCRASLMAGRAEKHHGTEAHKRAMKRAAAKAQRAEA